MAISACVVKLKYSQVTHMVKMIEARPCIWDPKCRDYHNRDIKAKAFNEVAKALNTDVEVICKKWSNVRTYYKKELNKMSSYVKGVSGTDEVYESKWPHYESMMFLERVCCRRDVIYPNDTTVKSEQYAENQEDSFMIEVQNEMDEDMTHDGCSNSSRSSTPLPLQITCLSSCSPQAAHAASPPPAQPLVQHPSSAAPSRKRKSEVNEELLRQEVQTVQKEEEAKPSDADLHFTNYVRAQLMSIPDSLAKDNAKLEIQRILMSAKWQVPLTDIKSFQSQ